jgi:hypothetical protein
MVLFSDILTKVGDILGSPTPELSARWLVREKGNLQIAEPSIEDEASRRPNIPLPSQFPNRVLHRLVTPDVLLYVANLNPRSHLASGDVKGVSIFLTRFT